MIKINLVGEGRKVVASKKKADRGAGPSMSLGGENLANMLLIALTIAGLLIAAGWWFVTNRVKQSKAEEIRVAQQRVEELEEIIAQVDEAKRKKALLEQKIQVITDLKNNQTGPVKIMDEVSKGLPDLLWLDRLDLKGGQVSLTGRSFSWNAVANLAEYLDEVPAFREPEGTRLTQQGDVYNFAMSFKFDPTAVSTGASTDEEEDADEDTVTEDDEQ